MKRELNELNYDKCSNCGHPAIEIRGRAFHVNLDDVTATDEDILFLTRQCNYHLVDEDVEEYIDDKLKELEEDIRDRVASGYTIEVLFGGLGCICKEPKIDHKKA